MNVSILDLFTIGIGPSSSHTVGPMRAAAEFIAKAEALPEFCQVRCDLYGSLAATGKGHGTDTAILLGWMGEMPDVVDVSRIEARIDAINQSGKITLPSGKTIPCDPRESIVFHREAQLPRHPNGMHFTAVDENEAVLFEEIIYSIGGGFICRENEWDEDDKQNDVALPIPFHSADELLEICESQNLTIAEIAFANESAFREPSETRAQLDRIWQAMQDCVKSGCQAEGILPGGLKVRRRAHQVHKELLADEPATAENPDPLRVLDWVNLFALAVNEENAAGGRVVTAPTNGAAGIIPAVLHYATQFKISPYDKDGIHRFLLTAGAIAMLYKEHASLSGADVGCQGEVGVACSMAAGALVEFLGGTPRQVECAAEIGMEHNLGLTCDPIGGLVQIPCIERNAMASVKAINAARLAMRGDGNHIVSLDKVIITMRETGRDMMTKYKETSRGGLAVALPEC